MSRLRKKRAAAIDAQVVVAQQVSASSKHVHLDSLAVDERKASRVHLKLILFSS